jgi:hypothetical protein
MEVANDLRVNPRNRGHFAGPIRRLMRPGEPRPCVHFPLRGHAETTLGGGIGGWIWCHVKIELGMKSIVLGPYICDSSNLF